MIKFFEKNNKLSWLFVIVIALIIFFISSLSFGPSFHIPNVISFIYHFLTFFWLAFFLSVSLIKGKKTNFILIAILIAVIYAISDEIHQLFVLYRNFSFSDILTDSIGIFFAIFIYIISLGTRKKEHI